MSRQEAIHANSMQNSVYFLIILIAGIVARILPLTSLPFDSDQAVVGLMANHMTKGEFPLLYYGDSYGGMLEQALAAVFFHFWKMDRLVLHLIPFLISILFFLSIYQLGAELFNRTVGLLGLLIAAFPLHYGGLYAALANGGYIEILWLGNILLIVCHRLALRKVFISPPFWGYFILGFLSGLAWWTHPLSLIYLVSGYAFLIFNSREFVFRGRLFLAISGFMCGSLPFWLWNMKNGFPFFRFVQAEESVDYGARLVTVGKNIMGFFGLDLIRGQWSIPVYLFVLLVISSLIFPWFSKKNLQLHFGRKKGLFLLWTFSLVFMLIYVSSRFSEEEALRYLLPVYSIFPISLALLVYLLYFRKRFVAFSLLAGVLTFLIYGYGLSLGLYKVHQIKNQNRSQVEESLRQFLKENHLRFSYCPEYWSGGQLTFDAGEDLIFTQPFNDRYPLYTLMADAALKPAFALDGKYIESFESMFQALGGSYKKKLLAFSPGVKGYALYYDFQPPPRSGKEVLPVNWKGFSNLNPEQAGKAFDRDLSSGWSSATYQKAGMVFQIDLGAPCRIDRLVLLPVNQKEKEFPVHYRLDLSADGKDWFLLASVRNNWAYLFWSLDRPFWKFRNGRMEINGNRQKARFIRITLTDGAPQPWTIGEVQVYEAVESNTSGLFSMKELLAFLGNNKIKALYADIGLSARITSLTQGKIKCLQDDYQLGHISEFPTRRYNEAFPFFNRLERRVDFSPSSAFVVEKENGRAFEEALKKWMLTWQVAGLGNRLIYSHFQDFEKSSANKRQKASSRYYWNGTGLFLVDSPGGGRP
jgi:hypothetical protein